MTSELHLFAGVGGGIIGGILLGHTCVCAVEKDKFCRLVMLSRQRDGSLPRFPIWDDVRTFDGKPWRGVDVLCAGFPCQDISSANHVRLGLRGKRSGLFYEVIRIARDVLPRRIFIENSSFLVSRREHVESFRSIVEEISGLGYSLSWLVLGASDVGAPHIRKRVWILADSNETGQKNRMAVKLQIFKEPEVFTGVGKWLDQPEIERVAHGIPRQLDRLGAVGDAQVPAVAAVAYRYLSSVMS